MSNQMKKMVVVAVVILALGILGFLLLGNNEQASAPSTSSSTSSQSSSNTETAPGDTSKQPTATDQVSISDFAFTPSSITVKQGTTVTWTNNDSVGHTVTENDSQTGPSSKTLNNGETYKFTFTKPGTYKYHCSLHSEMTGEVIVTE